MRSPAGKPTEPGQIALSALIAVYLFFTISWLSPESEARTRIVEPIKQFWLFWGLDQNWRLFSPVIKNINFHTVAVITFEDGYRLNWELPRMKRLDYFQRFRDEKYRKWTIDSLPWPDYKPFWPDFARYVGRKFYNPVNKPVSLTLQLYWIEIPKPETKGLGNIVAPIVPAGALPEHTKMNTVFFYRYQPGDLP